MALRHCSGPLPSSHRCSAFSGECSAGCFPCPYACWLQQEAARFPAQAWHHPGPHCSSLPGYSAGFSKTTPFYTSWENGCPRKREERALIDFQDAEKLQVSYPELLIWGASLERCLCPRSCEWSLGSVVLGSGGPPWVLLALRAHPSDTGSC